MIENENVSGVDRTIRAIVPFTGSILGDAGPQ